MKAKTVIKRVASISLFLCLCVHLTGCGTTSTKKPHDPVSDHRFGDNDPGRSHPQTAVQDGEEGSASDPHNVLKSSTQLLNRIELDVSQALTAVVLSSSIEQSLTKLQSQLKSWEEEITEERLTAITASINRINVLKQKYRDEEMWNEFEEPLGKLKKAKAELSILAGRLSRLRKKIPEWKRTYSVLAEVQGTTSAKGKLHSLAKKAREDWNKQ